MQPRPADLGAVDRRRSRPVVHARTLRARALFTRDAGITRAGAGSGWGELEAALLLGPTACGKSALAIRLAESLPLEIVSIDSAQVYRGMDIGTAKPTAVERARAVHHLIDIREPNEPYSVADFVRDANRAIDEIGTRGRLPLIVGGTMLYARALREGLSALPSASAAVRARIDARAKKIGWPALHAELARIDPVTAERLPPNDRQRIQRALEVFELTGVPLSQLQGAQKTPALRLATIALLPEDRAELHRRIEKRFDQMLAAGFLDEVRALMARGDLHPDLPSLRSVGYRQAWRHLHGESTLAQFRTETIAATRQLAKRQITWLRSMPDAIRIDPFAANALAKAAAVIAAHG